MKPLFVVVVLLLIESSRIIITGIIRKIEFINILAIGAFLFVALFTSVIIIPVLMGMTGSPPLYVRILMDFSFMPLPISMAIYLAKSYSKAHCDLEKQLIKVKELSQKQIIQERKNAELQYHAELQRKDNERKSKELEEARALQLSMLPREVPQLPELDISAFMKTATEVGGDYYDFYLDENNILTIVLGDATGHGMNAGTMVTATKSLFQNLASLPDVEQIIHQLNKSLCMMNLQPLFMSIILIRIQRDQVEIINAGMPESLIYNKKTDLVNKVNSCGPPLAAFDNYEYKKYQTKINCGDILLLMTDGCAERFDENNEIFGYERCVNIFKSSKNSLPSEIIANIVNEGDVWVGKNEQTDDITLIVIKHK
jgi:serine phosphatase RsbU (regulator of sigma subunit)